MLLVDDEPLCVRPLCRTLERKGLRPETAETVADAQRVIRSDRPIDYAIVDNRLPDGAGIELIPLLRSAHPRARAAVVSGYADFDLAVRGSELDVLVLPRPTDPERLAELIESLRQHRSERPGQSPEPEPGGSQATECDSAFVITKTALLCSTEAIPLHRGERLVLESLAAGAGGFVTSRQLAEGPFKRTDPAALLLVYQYACRLRKKLRNSPLGDLVESDRCRGYRLAPWAVGKVRVRSNQ